MKRIYVSITLCLILCSCAGGLTPMKRFISPSQVLYDQASKYFEKKDYDNAIATYEKFVKDYPRNSLAPGAHLGIAWSYYLKGDYEKSLNAQKNVKTKDETLKAWLDNLANNCKTKLAGSVSAATAPRLFDIPPFTNKETLKIEGTVPQGSIISINEIEASVKDSLFSQEISLKEGPNPIKIQITDKDNNIETIESEVILDTITPEIKVTDAEIDNLGYVTISGLTEKNSIVLANDEELFVSAEGKFEGEVKLSRNLKIELVSEDHAGNIAKMVFSDREHPDSPTGLYLTATSTNSADIEWNKNSEEDLKGYNVYYSLSGEFKDQLHNRELIRDTRYTIDSLESGNTYTIYVRAVDKMGNESNPSEETVSAIIP
ncbi:MAG: fibronectin type III domain-containing protein [Candidatus Omnitrophica bacterium]|nr:fibronectin type III domain-containing protein [Candidatus Omnitrophota bacterium]